MKVLNTEISNSTRSRVVEKVNFSACICIYAWMIIPYIKFIFGVIPFTLIFMLWVITTDLNWLIKKWSHDMLFVLFFFSSFLPLLFFGTLRYGEMGSKAVLINFPLFFVGLFIIQYYMHYKKDLAKVKVLGLMAILMYTFGSMQTIIGLNKYPMASRELAGTVWNDSILINLYSKEGIGAFGFIYAVCFTVISTTYLITQSKNKVGIIIKAIVFGEFVICTLMIIKASYATAVIFLFLGVLLMFVSKRKTMLIIGTISIVLLLLFVPSDEQASFFFMIAGWFKGNSTLYLRFNDLGINILEGTSSGKTAYRISLYKDSMVAFLRNPLFGIYGPFGDPSLSVGGHSGWLDFLAFYGLFSAIPLIGVFVTNIKKQIKVFENSEYLPAFIITTTLFIAFGVINPFIHVFELGFAYFAVIPIIPYISQIGKKKIQITENTGEEE